MSDYFIYPKGVLSPEQWPEFLVGEGRWDTWLMAKIVQGNIPLIDATHVVQAFHSEHFPETHSRAVDWNERRGKHLGRGRVFHSTWRLTEKGLLKKAHPISIRIKRLSALPKNHLAWEEICYELEKIREK